jgi:hypothetical protein
MGFFLSSLGIGSAINFSHLNLHRNWVGSPVGRPSMKITHFVPFHLQTIGNSCFWFVNFEQSCTLKQHDQIK